MVSYLAKLSLILYVLTIISFDLIFLLKASDWLANGCKLFILFINLYNILVLLLCRIFLNENTRPVAIRSVLLGILFALGIVIRVHGPEIWKLFGVYMSILSFFHFSEFFSMAIIQPNLVSVDSFVINHSKEYTIAAAISWIEFILEWYFIPGVKYFTWLSNIGLVMCIGGEFLRKLAMFTAKSNFTHIVQCEKQPGHVLVTHGIYRFFRHPSYVGWFYWSVGTQIVLLNPICILAYAYVSWHFFNERIYVEELTLLNFFGKQYHDYQKLVGTGIPLVEGYRIKNI